ncbi:MAG TPA: hypothetical protein DEV81_15915 [Cyanobacteria bacterium UBA11049]|nr:hypothetical protein [Cyanobacteria bacterium UBA11049]
MWEFPTLLKLIYMYVGNAHPTEAYLYLNKMNTNLVGNKKIFAIDYSVLIANPSSPYGDWLIWLGN